MYCQGNGESSIFCLVCKALLKLIGNVCITFREFTSHCSTLCSIVFPQLCPPLLVLFSFLLAGCTLLLLQFTSEYSVSNGDEGTSRITDSLPCEATM